MVDWLFGEALAVDTYRAVARWWGHRRPLRAASVLEGLVEDLQTARLALDDRLQHRLWDLAIFLAEPQRMAFKKKIAELDPWSVLSDVASTFAHPNFAMAEREAVDEELIAALNERARRRERLRRPHSPSKTRRRLRDLADGRGSLATVLKDDAACRMLRFGAILCELLEAASDDDAEPDPDELRAQLAGLGEANARRAAEAVLNDPLVGADDRGRPAEPEIMEFIRAVIGAVERRTGYRLTPTIARYAARSAKFDDRPGPDVQLILDLLACHAPSKTAEAVAALIKAA